MNVSDLERRQLHQEVAELMSDDSAAVLMRLLPPVGWNDFATKQDLEVLGDFMQLGFNNSMLEMRNEMRNEMHTEFVAVRKETQAGFLDLHKELNHQTHRVFMGMLGINTLLMSVAIAAFKLL